MMSKSYFALCFLNDMPEVRRIPVDAGLQNSLYQMFNKQEKDFRESIKDEIKFTGDWKPDEGEALFVNLPEQTSILEQAINGNSLSISVLDVANFDNQGVKAIFSGEVRAGRVVVQVQRFSAQQILNRRPTMFFANNVLNKLSNPAFTLDTKLVALIEDGRLKFKSFHNIRAIFDLSNLYRAATDKDISDFAGHTCLAIANIDQFKAEVDQTARKLIHAIQKDGTLDNHTAQEVYQRAQTVGLDINIQNGQVQMPGDRTEIKRLLRFLHDDIYEAPLSKQRYVTNSKKPD